MAMPYRLVLAAVVALVVTWPDTAWAYIGPGSGLTVIGAAFALIASVFVAIVGFVWYPIKRAWRRLTGRRQEPAATPRSAP
ncbi:MAG: hypothetical protein AB7O28_03750 [Vicinamibacterales bacterium]